MEGVDDFRHTFMRAPSSMPPPPPVQRGDPNEFSFYRPVEAASAASMDTGFGSGFTFTPAPVDQDSIVHPGIHCDC
jgi:hypothetical protein